MDSETYTKEVVHKKGSTSKKWVMTVIGLGCVMASFLIGLGVMLAHPTDGVPASVVSLVSQVVTFLGAVVGAYTTGQSFVDWKVQSSLSAMVSAESKQLVSEITEKHIDISSRGKEEGYEAQ
jgi:putative Mn2+ efflux pump MntP